VILGKYYVISGNANPQMTLKLFPVTRAEIDDLQNKILSIEHELVKLQHEFLLDSSGLGPYLDLLANRNTEVISESGW